MDKDTFFKYPKIKILGSPENHGILENIVEVTEKIDGTNIRLGLFSSNIIFGSRNRELELGDEKTFDRIFYHLNETLKTKKDEISEIQSEFGNVILFGEGAVRHTIGYDFDKMPIFNGFDIYSFKLQRFLDHKVRRKMFTTLGLANVPLISVGIIKKTDKIVVPKSQYYDGLCEGISIKNSKKQLWSKIVREEFKEKSKLTFGPNKKFAKDDTELFIATYCKNPRIEKIIFKQIDNGNKLDMILMKTVPTLVHKDIWEEEWEEIVMTRLKIDIPEVRKKIAKRVLSVLQNMITNTELNR